MLLAPETRFSPRRRGQEDQARWFFGATGVGEAYDAHASCELQESAEDSALAGINELVFDHPTAWSSSENHKDHCEKESTQVRVMCFDGK
jgi:hypothetical protein